MNRPGPATTHWEWWTPAAGDARSLLHYVAGAADPAWYRRVVDTEGAALVAAACGLHTRFTAAGILSRMGRPRCARCCARLGVPRGDGTPRNETSLGRAADGART